MKGHTTMLSKRTLHLVLLLALVAATVAVGLARSARVAGQDDASPVGGQDAAAKIEVAMSAAPASVSEHATIYDLAVDAAGQFIVLREGNNGWSCFPDAPATPSNDPMCLDQTWLAWLAAYAAGEPPPTPVLGLAYMLQGGSDASNTDPFATAPAEGEEWVASPPHVMLLLPGPIDQTVFSTDHGNGGPWIMWAGTPYEHIMMPVAEGEHQM